MAESATAQLNRLRDERDQARERVEELEKQLEELRAATKLLIRQVEAGYVVRPS